MSKITTHPTADCATQTLHGDLNTLSFTSGLQAYHEDITGYQCVQYYGVANYNEAMLSSVA